MVLHSMDKLLVMKDGSPVAFGPRDQVLASLMAQGEAKRA
jgi:ATP-binding cassette subfamily C protein EexD